MLKKSVSKNWLGAIWEPMAPGQTHMLNVQRVQYCERSPFQEIALVEHEYFGRGLLLDGVAQYWEHDEWMYHEHLGAVPLLFHQDPQRVLILGGGDGLVLREVLRDQRVQTAVLVDIDGAVIEACRTEHAELHEASFDHPKATIIVDDALTYLQTTSITFDIVIIDLVDAVESDALELYAECIERLQRVIGRNSIVVGHGCNTAPLHTALIVWSMLESHFAHSALYQTFLDSWISRWGFILASHNQNFMDIDGQQLYERLNYRTHPLRSRDPRTFPQAFHIAPYFNQLKQTLAIELELNGFSER